jgi:hypothetical protein
VLSTDGRGALRASVNAVWGPKALDGVVDIDVELDVDVDKAMARREGIDDTSVQFPRRRRTDIAARRASASVVSSPLDHGDKDDPVPTGSSRTSTAGHARCRRCVLTVLYKV